MPTGMRTARRKFEYDKKKDQFDRLDNLLQNNPSLFTPQSYQQAVDEINESGSFRMPSAGPGAAGLTAGTTPQQQPITSGIAANQPRFGKPATPKMTEITPMLAAAYPSANLVVGTKQPEEQLKQTLAVARTRISATGQQERQDKRLEGQTERQKAGFDKSETDKNQTALNSRANKAYTEYLKAKGGVDEDSLREEVAAAFEEAGYPQEQIDRFRAKEMPEEEESSWFADMLGSAAQGVKMIGSAAKGVGGLFKGNASTSEKDKFGYTKEETQTVPGKGTYKYIGNNQWQKIK